MDRENTIREYLHSEWALELPRTSGEQEMMKVLAEKINSLILHDFERLVSILYRIDVHEQKLRAVLRSHPETEAGRLIAELLVERQCEKAASREKYAGHKDESNEEKW